jgi:hypothetical protein
MNVCWQANPPLRNRNLPRLLIRGLSSLTRGRPRGPLASRRRTTTSPTSRPSLFAKDVWRSAYWPTLAEKRGRLISIVYCTLKLDRRQIQFPNRSVNVTLVPNCLVAVEVIPAPFRFHSVPTTSLVATMHTGYRNLP